MPPPIRRRRALQPVEITDGLIVSTGSLFGTFGGSVTITDGLLVATASLQGVVGVAVTITNGLLVSNAVLLGGNPAAATAPVIPAISPPPIREPLVDSQGFVTIAWARFYEDVYNLLK